MSAPISDRAADARPYVGRHRAETVALAHARAIAELYRVTWTTDQGPRHTRAMVYDAALRRFQEVRQTLGVLVVHLVPEAQWEQAVAGHAREVLA